MSMVNRAIEAIILALCSPWTSVAVASLASMALGAAIVLRFNGE